MYKRKLIVIEGLDGSGKATQAELLRKELMNKGCLLKKCHSLTMIRILQHL